MLTKFQYRSCLQNVASGFVLKMGEFPNGFWEKIHHGEKLTILSQKRYIKNLIEKWNMQIRKPVYEPVVISENVTDDGSLTYHSLLQQLVGAFFLTVTTRPDIAFAVNLLSQACKSLTLQDLIAAKEYYAI